jgi:hypothetical protein
MPDVTIPDVSLFTKERSKNPDTFYLTFTYEGIDIMRDGEPTRHLAWERITEWEIEQRRGGVLLTLRGSGSVTPLIIPKWRVDDLDEVLRDVTAGVPVPESTYEAELAAELELELERQRGIEEAVALSAVPEPELEAELEPELEPVAEVALAVEPVIEAAPSPEPERPPVQETVAFSDRYAETLETAPSWAEPVTAVSEPEPVPVPEPDLEPEPIVAEVEEEAGAVLWGDDVDHDGLDTVLWPDSSAPRLTGPRPELLIPHADESEWAAAEPSFAEAIEGDVALDEDVDSNLEWPSEESSSEESLETDGIPKLEWPAGSEQKKRDQASEADVPAVAAATAMIPAVEPSPRPTSERTFETPAARVERSASAADLLATEFSKVPSPKLSTPSDAPVQPRMERRKQKNKIEISWKAVSTASLLALLAAAVAIVLADSAGAIHFGFLG